MFIIYTLHFCSVYLILITVASKAIECLSPITNGCFRAAVFEHVQQRNAINSRELVRINLDVYENATRIAASYNSTIVVFPEYGIFFNVFTREEAKQFVEEIPNPLIGARNPCQESDAFQTTHPILYRLSCLAMNNKIYIAADMGDSEYCDRNTDHNCPSDGHYYYNTAVLFDSNGNLLAKYHKMNLFGENMFNEPNEPEIIAIDSPFGRLGLMICFDMIFKLPGIEAVEEKGIDTMIFPTWWFDELPFLSAAQYQEAWSLTNSVHVLASNIHLPEIGSLGSGIYNGGKGATLYTNKADGKARLLIADIPISRKTSITCNNNNQVIEFESQRKTMNAIKAWRPNEMVSQSVKLSTNAFYDYKVMDMKDTAVVALVNPQDSISTCQNQLCCTLAYSLSGTAFERNEQYYLIVANRTRDVDFRWCEEYCALVRCDLSADRVCESFSTIPETAFKSARIDANFSTKYIYPSVVSANIELIAANEWTFTIATEKSNSSAVLNIDNFNKPIMTFGFYGRCYDRDPRSQSGSSDMFHNYFILMNYFIVYSILIYFLCFE